MSQADVGVLMEIQIARDRFKADLDGMKADFEQWRQQATGIAIEIPVRLRDEATSQLATLLQSLQAQASAGISIPVNVGGGGGGGGLALPGAGSPIGPGPGRMSQLFGTGGSINVPAAYSSGGSFRIGGAFGLDQQGIGSENFSDPWNSYGGMGAGAGMSDPSGAGRGMRGMRGIRPMAAAYLAVHGVERLAQAAAEQYDENNPIYNPYETSTQNLRRAEGLYEGRATGVTGFINRGLGALGLGYSAREDLDAARYQLHDTELHERNIQRLQRTRETLREEGFTDARGRSTGGSFLSREREIGANAAIAGAGAGEFAAADASIDAEQQNQKEAIAKRIQHLREQGVSEQTLTQEMTSLTNSAGLQAQADRQRVAAQRDLFHNQTTVLSTRASGNYGLAVTQERALAEESLKVQFGDTPLTQQRIVAMRAENASNDTIRGWNMNMGTMESANAFDGNTWTAGWLGIDRARQNAERADPSNVEAVRARARENGRQLMMTEADRLGSVSDAIAEAGIDNPFESQRQSISRSANRQRELRPDLSRETGLVEFADLARVNREEDRITRGNRESVAVSRLRMGNAIAGGEWLHSRQGNPEAADALQLQFSLQRQLREHMGDNPHDVQLRESIKSVGAEQARQLLAHTSDPAARTRLMGLIRKNYGAGAADATDDAGSAAGSKELSDAADALRKAADALSGAKTLYVVK